MSKNFLVLLIVIIIIITIILIGLDNDLPKNGESYILVIPNFKDNKTDSVLVGSRYEFTDDKNRLIHFPKNTNINNLSEFVRNDTLWCQGTFHKMCFHKKKGIKSEFFEVKKFIQPIQKN